MIGQIRYVPALLGLLAVACGASVAHSPESAAVRAGEGAAPSSAAPAPKGVVEPLDLRTFSPVLAADELEAVRLAQEDGRTLEAAELLRDHMKASPTDGIERLRLTYALGLLWIAAARPVEAEASFLQAAQSVWPLQADAWRHVAELRFAAGRLLEAEQALTELGSAGSSTGALLRGRVLLGLGNWDDAERLLRSVVEKQPSREGRLLLARTLLMKAEANKGSSEAASIKRHSFELAREAGRGLSAQSEIAKEALEVQKLTGLSATSASEPQFGDMLAHLGGLVDAREFDEADEFAQTIGLSQQNEFDEARCEFDYLRAKILAGQRKWGEGADRLLAPTTRCRQDPELHAKILFNAGKFAAADARHPTAVGHYEELERLYSDNSLADDSRIRRAQSYLKMGSPKRFTELLQSLPEDYPNGDMTMEGVLELALYRMERKDFSAALSVLERAADLVRAHDSARGHEESGRERYFLARCRSEVGEQAAALDEYESIVRELPLSYYMLHAYSRLCDADPGRAQKALDAGLRAASETPFALPHDPKFGSDEFIHGMELLRVGEKARGRDALSSIGLSPGVDDSLLWGLALLYDRAGDPQLGHGIARGRLTDWFSHYPAGDWMLPWQVGFPRPHHEIVERESQATGVPEWFIYGVMREESTFDAAVVSHANAYGLMQLIIPTARAFGKKAGLPYSGAALKRPEINIALGSRVLQSLTKTFRDNPWLAIPGYNAGPGRPARWLRERPDMGFDVWVELIPYRETRRYTKRVLASRAAYAFLYQRDGAEAALILPDRLSPP